MPLNMLDRVEAVHCPGTIVEALRLLEDGGPQARFIAGGTDLIGEAAPSHRSLVDISRLGLAYVRRHKQSIRLGAGTTIAALAKSEVTRVFAGGLIASAAANWGSIQISNVATLGGNLANGSPAADMALPLLALESVALVQSARGKRMIPLVDFWHQHGKTVIRRGLLVEIQIRRPPSRNRVVGSFKKLSAMGDNVAIASVAITLEIDQSGKCTAARIAMGAVSPIPVRMYSAESFLLNQPVTTERFEQICRVVGESVSPISDFRGSAEYRRAMGQVMVKRALEDIRSQIEQRS
jgi:CO/xanthine dehydrogenase FAD-binding subunit